MVIRSNSTILSFLTTLYLCLLLVKSDNNPLPLPLPLPLAPALYVLGDSLLDSGNNNFLPTLAKAILPPYGVDFLGGAATGRFTNGKTVADFIADYLKLPFSPPYMGFRGKGTTTGLNYASATCGIMPETGKFLGGCLSLTDQVDLFQKTVERELPKHFNSSVTLSHHLSKSIFLVSIGSNDYINNYLEPNIVDSSRRYSPQTFADLLVHELSQQLQRLHTLGARKVVVFEIGPIGCIPSILRRSNRNGGCIEETNQLVILFNNRLDPMLKTLTSTLEGSSFVLSRVYSLMYNAIINPSKYGLADPSNPCCRIISSRVATCVPEIPSCKDVEAHIFWDGYHLTEAAYSITAEHCINDSIKQLVQV